MAYDVYFDKLLLPIAPSKIDLKINNQNKTLTLINESEINILKKPKLTDIDFDILLPQVRYPFARYKSGFRQANYYLSQLEKLKTNQKPLQFIVARAMSNGKGLFSTNMKVSLEDYKIREDSKEGFDVVVSISLKQYRDYGTKTVKVKKKKTTTKKKRASDTSPAPKKKAKTHKVVKGDCLWNIAKKYYGTGTRYPDIYKANKSLIDKRNKGTGLSKYTIYPNQVFTIPV